MSSPIAPSDRVVVVGAGLAGLAVAIRLAGAGREVEVLERSDVPGGVVGSFEENGYRFDTGPTVLTMPGMIDDLFAAVGESRPAELTLRGVSPSYRAHFADGSALSSYSDTDLMAAEVTRVCGEDEARRYRRLVRFLDRLYRTEFDPFMASNLDSVADLVRPEAVRLLALGGLSGLQRRVGRVVHDDRLRRLFTFQALYAGVDPRRARAIYAVIAYLDSIAGVSFPLGGMVQLPRALAEAGRRHGVRFRFGQSVRRVEVEHGRARAVITAAGERVPADVVVLAGDLTATYRDLLPDDLRPRRRPAPKYAPSAFVWHVGSSGPLPDPAHHSISFGRAWNTTFDEIIRRGELMSDPSLLISSPTVTDPSLAPSGRHTYYVLAPAPNLHVGSQDWAELAEPYRAELARVLAARGFDEHGAFSSGIEVSRVVTPADWAASGLTAGTPFARAHTLTQTGPLRHPTRHPGVPNLLFCGGGVQPGVGIPTVLLSARLAAQRVTG